MVTLLSTKFFIPRPAAGMVARTRLMERLDLILERPLALVSAPPGFGKTTVLAEWIHRAAGQSPDPRPLQSAVTRGEGTRGAVMRSCTPCWLALDPADNDPARYWTYLTGALRPLFHAAGAGEGGLEHILGLFAVGPLPEAAAFLDALINEAAGLEHTGVLFLDDYHVIADPLIHEGMAYLVEHLPPSLHLVIATRADPPLPLARMRARGQLLEMRAADLRFTPQEAGALFEKLTGIALPAEGLDALGASTEGWAAGLQMASIAMQSALPLAGQDPGESITQAQAFIDSFSGKHHFVLDYLAEEVFNRQPPEVQEFLLNTAVLDRFCLSLVEEVTGEVTSERVRSQRVKEKDPSSHPTHNSMPSSSLYTHNSLTSNSSTSPFTPNSLTSNSLTSLLHYLERNNLFLIPLDSERVWFRYHHLFVDLLRLRLQQSDPGRIPGLHRRASAWFEGQGLINEAIQHALSGEDWQRAGRLLGEHVEAFIQAGQLSTVMGWVSRLPREVLEGQPRLAVQLVWALAFANQLEEAAALIRPALEALERGLVADVEETHRLRGSLMMVQAFGLITAGEPRRALEQIEAASALLPERAAWEWSWLHWMRGYARRYLTDLPGAAESFREAVRLAKSLEEPGVRPWNRMVFLNDLAIVEDMWGHKRRAEAIYREALELGRQRAHGYLSRVEASLSQILLQQYRLEEALQHALTGLEWCGWWPSSNHRVLALVTLAWVRLVRGELNEVENLLRQADEERQTNQVLAANESFLDSVRVRWWLAQGDLASAGRWADQCEAGGLAEQPQNVISEARMLAAARVRVAQGRLGEALRWLTLAEPAARSAGRANSLVELLALKALALRSAALNGAGTQGGQQTLPAPEAAQEAALQALEESLRLAGEEGYVLCYRECGEPLRALLQAAARRSPELSSAVERVLASFPVDAGASGLPAVEPPTPGRAALPEPLTEREMDVLRLLAEGLSNREMAGRLVVSEGTIKTHVHNLIAKLDAQSRTHAIARARELGVL